MNDLRYNFFKYVSLNVLSMVGLSLYILIDTFFIAYVGGSNGMAALNVVLPIYGMMSGIAIMIGIGFGTRFKIKYDNYKEKCSIFSKGLYFVVIISSIFVLLGIFFAEKIVYILGARGYVIPLAYIYLKTVLIFAPAFMLNNLLNSFVRNDNNPALSTKAVVSSSVFNCVFDYVCMIPLNMGIFGAAFATGTSTVLSVIILSFHFITKKNTFRLTKTTIKLKEFFYMSSLGISSLINELSSSIVILTFNLILLKYSDNIGIAAYGVISNLALVVVSIFNGVGNGIQPLISENYAKKITKNIDYILKMSIILSIILSVIIYIILYTNSTFFTNIFNRQGNEELLKMSIIGINIYFLSIPFTAINMITAISMQSMEKPRLSFIISALRGIIIVIPFAIIFSNMYQIMGMWISYVATELVVSIISIIFIKKYANTII